MDVFYASVVMEELREKSFDITWGPDNGRPAGYYVSVPNYNGGKVVPLEVVEDLLRGKARSPRRSPRKISK